MKVILGINANHADSSACIIINDKLEVAIEEERLTRKKHYSGFPIKSIQECIKISKLKLVDITDVAFNTRPVSNIIPKSIFFLSPYFSKNPIFLPLIKSSAVHYVFIT